MTFAGSYVGSYFALGFERGSFLYKDMEKTIKNRCIDKKRRFHRCKIINPPFLFIIPPTVMVKRLILRADNLKFNLNN